MGFKIFGIGATENKDKRGEIIRIKGMDISNCSKIIDEHVSGNMSTVGSVICVEKIMNAKEANTPRKKQCWDIVKSPFVYFEAELADDEGHPDAQATAALIKFTHARPNLPLKIGASVEGLTLRRESADKAQPEYKNIANSIAEGFAVTCNPCNQDCILFPYNTLTKSESDEIVPTSVIDRLIMIPMSPSIIEHNRADLETLKQESIKLLKCLKSLNIETLKKSLDDVESGGICTLKCNHCSKVERLFKSSKRFPNRCSHCGNAFQMKQFWDALNE